MFGYHRLSQKPEQPVSLGALAAANAIGKTIFVSPQSSKLRKSASLRYFPTAQGLIAVNDADYHAVEKNLGTRSCSSTSLRNAAYKHDKRHSMVPQLRKSASVQLKKPLSSSNNTSPTTDTGKNVLDQYLEIRSTSTVQDTSNQIYDSKSPDVSLTILEKTNEETILEKTHDAEPGTSVIAMPTFEPEDLNHNSTDTNLIERPEYLSFADDNDYLETEDFVEERKELMNLFDSFDQSSIFSDDTINLANKATHSSEDILKFNSTSKGSTRNLIKVEKKYCHNDSSIANDGNKENEAKKGKRVAKSYTPTIESRLSSTSEVSNIMNQKSTDEESSATLTTPINEKHRPHNALHQTKKIVLPEKSLRFEDQINKSNESAIRAHRILSQNHNNYHNPARMKTTLRLELPKNESQITSRNLSKPSRMQNKIFISDRNLNSVKRESGIMQTSYITHRTDTKPNLNNVPAHSHNQKMRTNKYGRQVQNKMSKRSLRNSNINTNKSQMSIPSPTLKFFTVSESNQGKRNNSFSKSMNKFGQQFKTLFNRNESRESLD